MLIPDLRRVHLLLNVAIFSRLDQVVNVYLVQRLLILLHVVVPLLELTAVLLVSESHATVLICQRVEQLLDCLVFLDAVWHLTMGEEVLELLLLLTSNLVNCAAIRALTVDAAELTDDVLFELVKVDWLLRCENDLVVGDFSSVLGVRVEHFGLHCEFGRNLDSVLFHTCLDCALLGLCVKAVLMLLRRRKVRLRDASMHGHSSDSTSDVVVIDKLLTRWQLLLRLLEKVEPVSLGELVPELLLEVLLDLALCHQWQVVERGRRDAHLFKLLFGVGLDRERKLNLRLLLMVEIDRVVHLLHRV